MIRKKIVDYILATVTEMEEISFHDLYGLLLKRFGLTQRTTRTILNDLDFAGLISSVRVGDYGWIIRMAVSDPRNVETPSN